MAEQLHLTDSNLGDYLREAGLVGAGETVQAEKAGDGNINWVRRARVEGPRGPRSFIVKQARPALERFPQYRVSTERLLFEARWLERARPHDADGVCPAVHGFDADERVLVLEDLGDAERLDLALARGADASAVAARLAALLGRVHAASRGDAALEGAFRNDAMRRLHGDHIFALPYQPNDFPLEGAVRERAEAVRADRELVEIAEAAYARYLAPEGALVHGDVQAANVLLPETGPKLLDAEIAHVGDPAFDLGTLVAHLLLPAVARGAPRAAVPAAAAAWRAYLEAHAGPGAPAFAEAARYAGLEMMRRTIGAARVPLVEEEGAALRVVDAASALVRAPAPEPEALAR